MIVHILRFGFRDDASEADRAEVLAALERQAAVDAVSFSVIGPDLGDGAGGVTHAYCVGLADFDALRRYLYDPSHRDISRLFASRLKVMTSVDFADDPDPGLGARIEAMHQRWLAEDPELAELLGRFDQAPT